MREALIKCFVNRKFVTQNNFLNNLKAINTNMMAGVGSAGTVTSGSYDRPTGDPTRTYK